MKTLYEESLDLFPYTRDLRRDLHRHPELAFREVRTAGIVTRELSALGLEVTTGVAQTGVVAMLEGSAPGPVVLVRFDMDALPIYEETGAEYASENPGVMHACGHDGHVAVGLTVARLLSKRRGDFQGAVKFIFQPAEEGAGGAEGMLHAGVLEHPTVDTTLSMHLWNDRPVGWVGVTSGPLMAGADIFEARITGKGGHGALPQETIDPVVTAAHIITMLQTVVSRNVSPLETAVVSVGRLRAGEAFNVIPHTVEFNGTVRTFSPEVRARVVKRMEEVINGVAAAMGCTSEFSIRRMTPAVINDAAVAAVVEEAVRTALPDAQIAKDYRTMVSEDMAFLMEKVPGCYVMVGSATPDGPVYGHHHPKFDIDERAMPRAAAVMAAAALEALGANPG